MLVLNICLEFQAFRKLYWVITFHPCSECFTKDRWVLNVYESFQRSCFHNSSPLFNPIQMLIIQCNSFSIISILPELKQLLQEYWIIEEWSLDDDLLIIPIKFHYLEWSCDFLISRAHSRIYVIWHSVIQDCFQCFDYPEILISYSLNSFISQIEYPTHHCLHRSSSFPELHCLH